MIGQEKKSVVSRGGRRGPHRGNAGTNLGPSGFKDKTSKRGGEKQKGEKWGLGIT